MLNLWPLKIHSEPRNSGENSLNELVFLGLCMVALITPFFLHPSPTLEGTHTQLLLPPCIFKWVTHIPCPFCGATTSFTLLAHGKLGLAFLANPWGPLFFLYDLILSIYILAAMIRRRSLRLEVNLGFTQGMILFGTIWAVKLLVWLGRTFFWHSLVQTLTKTL